MPVTRIARTTPGKRTTKEDTGTATGKNTARAIRTATRSLGTSNGERDTKTDKSRDLETATGSPACIKVSQTKGWKGPRPLAVRTPTTRGALNNS